MEQVTDKQQAEITTKPRSGVVAFFLSLLFPGLGQVYNGQIKKAIIFLSLILFIPLIFGLTRGVTFFYGVLTWAVIIIALRIYIIIDGVKNARRQKEYIPKPYNTWYYHLLIAIGIFAVFNIFNTTSVLGTKSFVISVTANSPTLQLGDYVVADMRAYRNSFPDYGDIVVFSHSDGQIWAFRVIGLPGDSIEIIDNIVSINGRPNSATFISETINDGVPVFEYEVGLPNGHRHLIYREIEPIYNPKANVGKIVIPPGYYFLLGDNRDNAADSRYEGLVSRDRIKGRIIYSYWGQTTKRINIDFRNK